ncbi:MAG: GAF domain-containing protein [Anaerolineae bacterium]
MSDQETRRVGDLARTWRRLVFVSGKVDEDETRRGVLLNTLAVLGFFIAACLLILVVVGAQLGYFGSTWHVVLTGLFPVVFLLLSVLCLVMTERGRVDQMAKVYVWSTLAAVITAAALFNGYRSATWLLVLWPVALAGSLFQPVSALLFVGVAFSAYLGVAILQIVGGYVPPMATSPESFPFFALSFGWLMIVSAAGFVSFINLRSLRGLLDRLRRTSAELVGARQDLAGRVDTRARELGRRAEQFRAIAELSQAAVSIQNQEELLRTAARLISERLGFYHVGIFLLDTQGEWAVLRAASSEGGQRMLARGHRLRIGAQGIVGYVAERGIPRFAHDVGEDAVWFNNPDLPDTKSEIALPLIIGDCVIGVLDIQTQEPAAFDDDDLGTFRVLADGIAVAIENARLLEQTRVTMDRLRRYQDTDAVEVWRQALARRDMKLAYAYELGETEPSPSGDVAIEEELDSVEQISSPDRVTRMETADGQHLILAPIHVAGQRLGLLRFQRSEPWSDESVQLVEAVVDQLDLALENARLIEETRLRASQEAARSEIVSHVRALTSTDAILRSAAEELGRALRVERSRIQLVRFDE